MLSALDVIELCLCLVLIILGTLTAQGAIPRNKKKDPSEVFARKIDCDEDVGGYCAVELPCEDGFVLNPQYLCRDPLFCCTSIGK